MTILVLLIVWFASSVVLAFALGALIRAGRGSRSEEWFAETRDATDEEAAGSVGPGRAFGPEDLAA